MSEHLQKRSVAAGKKGLLEERIAQLRDRKPVYLNQVQGLEMQSLAVASFQEQILAGQIALED